MKTRAVEGMNKEAQAAFAVAALSTVVAQVVAAAALTYEGAKIITPIIKKKLEEKKRAKGEGQSLNKEDIESIKNDPEVKKAIDEIKEKKKDKELGKAAMKVRKVVKQAQDLNKSNGNANIIDQLGKDKAKSGAKEYCEQHLRLPFGKFELLYPQIEKEMLSGNSIGDSCEKVCGQGKVITQSSSGRIVKQASFKTDNETIYDILAKAEDDITSTSGKYAHFDRMISNATSKTATVNCNGSRLVKRS